MRTLKPNLSGSDVTFLQRLLTETGFQVNENGSFDEETLEAVKSFQKKNQLGDDGIVGKDTWKRLLQLGYSFAPVSKNLFLPDTEYLQELHYKKQIILHHTAGGPRPDYTIGWWEQDTQRVGTAFVIGRNDKSEDKYDGSIYRAFPEYYWAHHLGLSSKNSKLSADLRTSLNKTSIGIEICSYGPVIKQEDGSFKALVNQKNVPESDVTDLGETWRTYQYFQKYTTRQIESCKKLILTLAWFFNIPIENIIYDKSWFSIQKNALNAAPGIWTHVNYRKDKTDCFPQPELIDMLNSLHAESKTFIPEMENFESFEPRSLFDLPVEDLTNYSYDLQD